MCQEICHQCLFQMPPLHLALRLALLIWLVRVWTASPNITKTPHSRDGFCRTCQNEVQACTGPVQRATFISAKMGRLNLRRGFNRIYLIPSLLWCFYVLYWPIKTKNGEYRYQFSFASDSYQSCRDARLKTNEQCTAEWTAELRKIDHGPLSRNSYLFVSDGSYVGLLLIPLAMAVPPVIVYGILLGLVKLALWIINGFRT